MMAERCNRRNFLSRSAIFSAGLAGTQLGLKSSFAAAPIERLAGHAFKFSMAAYSYHDLLSGDKPKLALNEFVHDCAKMQLDGVELTSYYFPKEPTREYLTQLKGLCFREGLDVSGTAVGNDFCHPPGEERNRQIQYVKDWVDHAAVLGAPVIRIFAGYPRKLELSEARKLVVSAIEECCEYAGKSGIYLALENHGGLTNSADDLLQLVRDVRSPWLGVNLDTGNFHSDDVYGDLAKVAPYAVNVQVKVITWTRDDRKVPTDFKRIAKLLASSGYRGYVVLEFEKTTDELKKKDPRTACPHFMRQLKDAFAAAQK